MQTRIFMRFEYKAASYQLSAFSLRLDDLRR
jgi:hypothetical protein